MSRPGSPPNTALHASVTPTQDHGQWQRARQHVRSGAAPQADRVDQSSWSHIGPKVWSSEARSTLATELRATLQDGVHGLCFSPYLEGQQPGSQVSEAQIRERLAILQPHAGWVRTFSCTDGHEQTPRVAHELGLKTLVGAWLGTDAEINEREIASVIEVARAGHAEIVAAGNEVMLREEMSEDALLGFI